MKKFMLATLLASTLASPDLGAAEYTYKSGATPGDAATAATRKPAEPSWLQTYWEKRILNAN